MIPDHLWRLPCWRGDIAAEPLSGGLSNEIWKVTDGVGVHVARFGRDYPFHHVDRAREAMVARAAEAAGFAPAVEYTAPGVMVTAYLDARPWSGADLAAHPEATADLLRRFHGEMGARVTGPGFIFWPFHVIRDYAHGLEGTRWAEGLDETRRLVAEMEAVQVPMPVVFGHHDLLPANFLDDGTRPWLIDFEYAGFGTAMFDLASVAANAGMDDAAARGFLAAYLGAPPDAAFVRAFDAMQVVAVLREALWAMVSDLHLSTPGVDYPAYAEENLARLKPALARYRERHGSLT